MERRELPSVDRLLREPEVAALRATARSRRRAETLAQAREEIAAGHDPGDLVAAGGRGGDGRGPPRLRRVINATGVVLHTNLGRAPLADAALGAVRGPRRGYSNLEYDLDDGRARLAPRPPRRDAAPATGAEDALVVNNNAAALLLALAALAEGREVIVSRGELVEIGGGFRIPDILARSGARLVEVGTTNRTRAADYERRDQAPTTRAAPAGPPVELPRSSASPSEPALAELVGARAAARRCRSSTTSAPASLLRASRDEPLAAAQHRGGRRPRRVLAATSCSAGRRRASSSAAPSCVGRLRRHPLQRALRPDKLTLAALEGTLLLYLEPDARGARFRCCDARRSRSSAVPRAGRPARRGAPAARWSRRSARVGGGALPLLDLPSAACALEGELAAALPRPRRPPVVARRARGRTLLDCRTIARRGARRGRRRGRGCRPCDREPAHARHRRPHRPRQDARSSRR